MMTAAILGLGGRGRHIYAPFFKQNSHVKLVAIAEIRPDVLEKVAGEYDIPADKCFHSAEEFLAQPKMCDIVLVCTLDQHHYAHSKQAIKLGYHLIMEKPIAQTYEQCLEIEALTKQYHTRTAVCHVLRYSPFFCVMKDILKNGNVGKIVNINHTENVGYWHQAHSYVRGNWRNSKETVPMILAKCSHDLDIIYWMMDSRCKRVSSFGRNLIFNSDNAPEGCSERCLDGACKVKESCVYDAEKIYMTNETTGINHGNTDWPNFILTDDLTPAGIENALRTGPYGRCVYHCDNNVVDTQVTNMEFENGATATLTMTAFSKEIYRSMQIHCSEAEIVADMMKNIITVHYFNGKTDVHDIGNYSENLAGHGGGDIRFFNDFIDSIVDPNAPPSPTNLFVSMVSHSMAFAAEQSRINGGKVVEL